MTSLSPSLIIALLLMMGTVIIFTFSKKGRLATFICQTGVYVLFIFGVLFHLIFRISKGRSQKPIIPLP